MTTGRASNDDGGTWRPRRLVLFAISTMLSCFLLVFVADAGRLRGGMVVDAIANCVAAAIPALLVWRVCRFAPWQLGDRWWFFPLHVAGVLGFSLVWYLATGVVLGVSTALGGGSLELVFLHGPALHWQLFTGVVLYFAVAAGCYATQAAREARAVAELRHAAEMAALRTQLDPHFLFNTLHSLLELVRSNDTRADEAIDRFARVARYVGDGRRDAGDTVSLADEWAMARDYVALETLRVGPRLTCEFLWADGLERVRIPALSVQPLVENAIRHGIVPRPGPGRVAVSARAIDGRLHLRVEDDGLGAAATTSGTGVGLHLVRRRLAACHGEALAFSAAPRDGGLGGWCVDVSFPVPAARA